MWDQLSDTKSRGFLRFGHALAALATWWPVAIYISSTICKGLRWWDPKNVTMLGARNIPDEKGSERCFAPASWTLWPCLSQAAGWVIGLPPFQFHAWFKLSASPKFCPFPFPFPFPFVLSTALLWKHSFAFLLHLSSLLEQGLAVFQSATQSLFARPTLR